MRARRHSVADGFAGDDSTDRKSAAKPLGNGDDVGPDARCLVGEQRAGTPDAALHLVCDHQRAELVRRGANPGQIFILSVTRTAISLHRLDHHRRHMRAHPVAKRVQIAEGDMLEPVGHRTEPGPVGRLVGRR